MPEFITSYGDKIPFVEGYRDLFGRQHTPTETLARPDRETPPIPFSAFVKDRYLYGTVVDLLAQTGIAPPFGRVMELGAGEATFSRLLRGSGKAKQAVAVDIQHRDEALPTALFNKYQSRFRRQRWFSKLLRSRMRGPRRLEPSIGRGGGAGEAASPGAAASRGGVSAKVARLPFARKAIDFYRRMGSEISRPFGGQGYYPGSDSEYFTVAAERSAQYDAYRRDNVYEMSDRYDTIFAVLCLEYFNSEEIFTKVSELLDDGGSFIVLVNSWWYPRNATEITGNFPWASQRLTREDTERYFREFHPDEAASTMELYDYFTPEHPTIRDYSDTGMRHGLTPIVMHPLMSPQYRDGRAVATPMLLAELEDTNLHDVLNHIHQFRPDVSAMDLMTKFYFMVFRRQPREMPRFADATAALGITARTGDDD